jgi:hypothetical protein
MPVTKKPRSRASVLAWQHRRESSYSLAEVVPTNLDTVSFTYMRSAADCVLRAHL